MSVDLDVGHKMVPLEDSSSHRRVSFSREAISYFLATADVFIILLSCSLGGIAYQLSVGNPIPGILPQIALGLLASFIYTLRLSGSGYYDFPDSAKPRVEVRDILVCWFTTGLILAFFAFLLKVGVDYSRGAFVVFYFLAPACLLGVRKLTKIGLAAAISRGAIGRRDILLVGDFNEIAKLESGDLLAVFGAGELNQFTLSREFDPSKRTSSDLQIINSVARFVRRHNCREILLALPWSDSDRIEFVRDHIKMLPVAARLLPDTQVRSLSNFKSSARRRVLAIEIQRAPLSSAQRFSKRVMDVLGAALALIVLLPIMILTAIAIRLDGPGPVIFRQSRKGFNGKEFVIFKFRTMKVLENGPAVLQATRGDARVTPIGHLLRSASIDELPQLLNVLKGDMSLIGPRPHALAHDDYFEGILSGYAFRHHVKPGITGWAQCNGARGATPSIEHIAERVKLDLWYINNWSFWLDIQILIKTFFEILRKRNAY